MHIALGVSQLRFSIPLGLAYVAAVLEKAGHRVSLFVYGRSPRRAIERLVADPPDLVAYGLLSGEQGRYLQLHHELRRRLARPSIWGGAHPTFFPDLAAEDGVDAICRGEAEEAIVEFVDRYAADGRLPTDVRNFWVRGADGEIARNPVRPLIHDLDAIPFPNRALFYAAHPLFHEHGVKHFVAHRGCPYKCTYCFNQSYHRLYGERRPTIRSREPRLVCDEIDIVRHETRLEMVAFVDDGFTLDLDWLARFADVYPRRIGLPYSCNFRLDDFSSDTADLLAASGCKLAYVGVESGDDVVRRSLLGRRMSNEQIIRAVGWLHERGIRVITENMIGLPGETFEQARRTLEINMTMRPMLGNCSIFTPYPDLPLTRLAIHRGCFDGSFDKLGGNYYHGSVLTFASRGEKNKILNLRCFFSLLSRHPRLWPLVRPLLSLPANGLTRIFGDIADGHYLQRCLPYSLGPGRFVRILGHYLWGYR